MTNWTVLNNAIRQVIYSNGTRDITGQILQTALLNIVNNVGSLPAFGGTATPSTNPGVHDGPVFYIATAEGTYSNFNNIAIAKNEVPSVLMCTDNTWSKQVIGTSVSADISALESALASEVSRAQAKEAELQEAIVDQNDEIEDFKSVITDQVNNYQPVVIEGDVTNAADEEDITSENGLLKIKNRSALNGMGYVILRRGSSFASQVTLPNTIYEIRYDFEIEGTFELNDISFVLNGGSLKLISNNVSFVNSNRISIVAINGEKILANGLSSVGTGDGLIEFRSCQDILVRGVCFDYADVNKNFIYLNSCMNTKVESNIFTGLVTGSGEPRKCVYSIGSQFTTIINNLMQNVRGGITLGTTDGKEKDAIVTGNTMDGLYLSGVNCFAENVVFSGNVFRNIGFGGQVTCIAICGDGVSGVESNNIAISGNTFIASCNAIQADCTRGGHISNITIVGNSISDCGRGAYMASTRGNLIITSNSFEKINTIGIDCTDVSDAVIANNRIKGTANTQYGIRVLPLETDYVSQNAGNVDVIGNRITSTGQGLYIGQTINNYCEAIRCINNAISNCNKGITATVNTNDLLIDGNVLNNTTDLDIRTQAFILRDNNKYTTISSQTIIEKVIDISTETPVIKQNGTYTISSETSYTLRGFNTQEDVNRITIVILSDNITIAKNAQLYPLCGQSFMPLINSSLTFEKIGSLWKEVGYNGNLNVVSEQTLPTTTRRKGLCVYNDTLSLPIYSTGNKWICADGYSAKKRQGTTQERPSLTGDIGFQYFDTDLGKPIYWTGVKWVDATGADLT